MQNFSFVSQSPLVPHR